MSIYVIGYGSLFKKSSLNRTMPSVDEVKPILLNNYTRSWDAVENITPSFSTTYLGVQKSNGKYINAIIFEVNSSAIKDLDKREFLYSREKVDINNIEFLSSSFQITKNDDVWIYVTNNPSKPSKNHPIIQSYLDICLSGCFEIEENFLIDNFAKKFVETTNKWSRHWVNDRIIPRAPHIHQPYAHNIDKLLYENLEDYFTKIVIE
ncbi:gamma-glutamylcyclotransferase family protein [Sulfurimonas sp.]